MGIGKYLAGLACFSLQLGCAESYSVQPEPSSPAQPVQSVIVEATAPVVDSESSPVHDESESAPASMWVPGEPVPALWLRPELATGMAPEHFVVIMETDKGQVTVRVVRAWAPQGVDRFYNLVRIGFYTDIALYRAIDGFMIQFGIHGVPEVSAAWKEAKIPDDPVVETNGRGKLSFAMAGPNSRTVQLFINTTDNRRLDQMNFSPFGEVIEGMEVVDSIYTGYGEGGPGGKGPNQVEMQNKGNEYVRAEFPKLDFIRSIRLVP